MSRAVETKAILEQSEPSLSPTMFRTIFGGLPAGVSVVTALDEASRPIGLTVSAVMSISLSPPLLAVCLDNSKYTLEAIKRRGHFGVNFLSGRQAEVSNNFAFGDHDKFAAVDWAASEHAGVPILKDVRAHAECAVWNVVEAGDHTLIIGHILSGAVSEERPLTYYSRQYVDLVFPQSFDRAGAAEGGSR